MVARIPNFGSTLDNDPVMQLRTDLPTALSRDGSIGVSPRSINDNDSLESIGIIEGSSRFNDNISYKNTTSSYTIDDTTYMDGDNSVSSTTTGGSKKVRFDKNVKKGNHDYEGGDFRHMFDTFAEMTLHRCSGQCGGGGKALNSVLSNVELCACGKVQGKGAQCCAGCGNFGDDQFGEQNDLVYRDIRDPLMEARELFRESHDALLESRDAILESRDAIRGSHDELRDAIEDSRHVLAHCRDAIIQARTANEAMGQLALTPMHSFHDEGNLKSSFSREEYVEKENDNTKRRKRRKEKRFNATTPPAIKYNTTTDTDPEIVMLKMDEHGGDALVMPTKTKGRHRVKRNKKKTTQENMDSDCHGMKRKKKGINRLVIGGVRTVKAPLKSITHCFKSSRPKPILTIKHEDY